MNINFNRNRAQLLCESFLNCKNLEEWRNSDFKNFQINNSQAKQLSVELKSDSKDLYHKGILSFFEGLRSIQNSLYSWATVKLYYSLFYFLRCMMALNNVAIIRQKSLFYLKAIAGEKPQTKNNRKYNSDHSGTINYFIDLFNSYSLLSQNIEGINCFEWIMNKRDQINYREREFHDPGCSNFWEIIESQVKAGRFKDLLKKYILDNFIICFQEEHSILAIPIKQALLTKSKVDDEGITLSFSKVQRDFLLNLIPYNMDDFIRLI